VREWLEEKFYRVAASGFVPRRFFAPALPDGPPPPSGRPLTIEIVSHCWRYGALLAYQLSSLALHPPGAVRVRMTVFHSTDDEGTVEVLDFFGGRNVPGVEWKWWPLERSRLFRRAIGRDLAARATTADWVFFTDCDVLFHEGALDALGRELEGRKDILVYPRTHSVSELLDADAPVFRALEEEVRVVDIDPALFTPEERDRAVGGLQIVRGDVARAAGYCGEIALFQRPTERWRKTREDRVFRWLLGTQGTPVEVPGIFRIRHRGKGRKGVSIAR
jgi:hypothetical protein